MKESEQPKKGACELCKDAIFGLRTVPKDLWLVNIVTNG